MRRFVYEWIQNWLIYYTKITRFSIGRRLQNSCVKSRKTIDTQIDLKFGRKIKTCFENFGGTCNLGVHVYSVFFVLKGKICNIISDCCGK